MLRSSFFVSRKRKKPKDKAQPSSSDDDLDSVFPKKEPPEQGQALAAPPTQAPWSLDDQEVEMEERRAEDGRRREPHCSLADKVDGKTGNRKDSRSSASQPSPSPSPKNRSSPSPILRTRSPYTSPSHSPSLSYRMQTVHQSSLSDPPSTYEDAVSDLGTMNSTSSQASAARPRQGRAGPEAGSNAPGAEVCSITSDYSTTSSMTFLTGAELNALSLEVRSVAESRGGEDADDERSELVSEGRAVETDSESELSVFASGKEAGHAAEIDRPDVPDSPRPLPSHRLIECDTLSRKKSASARLKTESESSADGGRDGKPAGPQGPRGASPASLSSSSSSSRCEADKTEPAWRLKITDRLKFRLRTSADDMFGVGTQRSRSPEGRAKKKNIRRRHTMGGQRDFAQLSVLGGWQEQAGGGSRAELSAVDRLKPKCSSQDFSIREWIARERHRASNPEVSFDAGAEQQGDPLAPAVALLNGDPPQGKSLSLSATAHPHKLSGAQVVHSRFYQYL